MAPLIVSEFVSLDGVMEAPGGEPTHPHTAWTTAYESEDRDDFKFREVLAAGSLLVGRVTYESFAGAWPRYEGAFADRMNAMPKYVVSSTLDDPPAWSHTTILRGDAVEAVRALKEREEAPILVAGSGMLVQALVDAGLVDELRLQVFPVIIGGGLRPFSEARHKVGYRLVDTTPFDSGVVNYSYRLA
jgi:dihydrofolate reductase